jgi:hypothetical protein
MSCVGQLTIPGNRRIGIWPAEQKENEKGNKYIVFEEQ